MRRPIPFLKGLLAIAACLTLAHSARAQVLADSIAEFSGVQGQGDWYYGYRNYTADGGAENYDPVTGFIAFAGGDGAGEWDGSSQFWQGAFWDLETAATGPWTEIRSEATHPNGANSTPNEEHWVVRRWVANELTGDTSVTVRWHTRKGNTSGGGVTGGVWVNGVRLASVALAGNNTAGVTRTNFVTAKKGDRFDLVLTPVGASGDRADGSDGSSHWMTIERSVDTDSDGLPDLWEQGFTADLTKLTSAGDADGDGLNDAQELARGANPLKADSDDDGLADSVETNTGVFVGATNTGTDPLKADTDGDGRKDGDEININPKTDPFDFDSDDDTYSDGLEVANGHNPKDAADTLVSSLIANSIEEFSGNQGQDGWTYGYRNATADGGAIDYNATANFIAFAGGDGLGDWDGTAQQWGGSQWDLNTAAAAPWTELGRENVHPNGPSPVHWVIRRWEAKELTKVTPLALRYHVRKGNTGCGNGVTSSLHINGKRVDTVTIAANDGTGVVRTVFANVAPTDRIDVTLTPRGTDNTNADGCDGSNFYLHIDPVLPEPAFQPDGTLFVPVNPPDTDADGIADLWEKLYFPGDLTRLTVSGDYDNDGLKDPAEYARDSDPTKADTDGDGLGDAAETKTGIFVNATDTGTDPRKADSDGDTLSDAAEVQGRPATNPTKADTDGDKFLDAEELAEGSNPNDPADNPLTGVIATSSAEFSGVQGKDGWDNGYRNFTVDGGAENYTPSTEFIAYPGGEGQGDWDGSGQYWTGTAWDMETAAAGPWTYQASESIHPNGANSAPNEEHWAIRRWVANELTGPTPVSIIWQVKKENPAGGGVGGALYINGKKVDSVVIAGNDISNPKRRHNTQLAKGDIVDLVLTPENVDGTRADGSDGSVTWFWVSTKVPVVNDTISVTRSGNTFQIAFPAGAVLQSSASILGPWT
ncbi:MAG: hypothetical protein JNL97_02795, partial [Verrucomicrobiales bacterium]|nr:hypothetical protein [Verrucomicrobiales bacterium]